MIWRVSGAVLYHLLGQRVWLIDCTTSNIHLWSMRIPFQTIISIWYNSSNLLTSVCTCPRDRVEESTRTHDCSWSRKHRRLRQFFVCGRLYAFPLNQYDFLPEDGVYIGKSHRIVTPVFPLITRPRLKTLFKPNFPSQLRWLAIWCAWPVRNNEAGIIWLRDIVGSSTRVLHKRDSFNNGGWFWPI